MSLQNRLIETIDALIRETSCDAHVEIDDDLLTLTDPHGRGAPFELSFGSESRLAAKIGIWTLLELESADADGLIDDVKDIVTKVLTGQLEEHLWHRGDKIIASRVLGLGYGASRSSLIPRSFGSKEVMNYDSYRCSTG